jgi:hypothetical protein
LLKCAEVGTAGGVGNHNLTVDHSVQRKGFRRAHDLRERDAEVLQVPAEDPRPASVGSPQQAAEAIEFGLVAPLGSARLSRRRAVTRFTPNAARQAARAVITLLACSLMDQRIQIELTPGTRLAVQDGALLAEPTVLNRGDDTGRILTERCQFVLEQNLSKLVVTHCR